MNPHETTALQHVESRKGHPRKGRPVTDLTRSEILANIPYPVELELAPSRVLEDWKDSHPCLDF